MKDEALQTLVDLYEELLAFVEKNGGWEKTTALVIARLLTVMVRYVILPVGAITVYLSVILYERALQLKESYTNNQADLHEVSVEFDDEALKYEKEASGWYEYLDRVTNQALEKNQPKLDKLTGLLSTEDNETLPSSLEEEEE